MRVSASLAYVTSAALVAAVVGALWVAPSRAQQSSATPASKPATTAQASGAASGPVLEVGPGAKYTSIQSAIDAAPDGATVRVAAGTYAERITIRKPLTLEGAGWEQTTIRIPNAKAAAFAD